MALRIVLYAELTVWLLMLKFCSCCSTDSVNDGQFALRKFVMVCLELVFAVLVWIVIIIGR